MRPQPASPCVRHHWCLFCVPLTLCPRAKVTPLLLLGCCWQGSLYVHVCFLTASTTACQAIAFLSRSLSLLSRASLNTLFTCVCVCVSHVWPSLCAVSMAGLVATVSSQKRAADVTVPAPTTHSHAHTYYRWTQCLHRECRAAFGWQG